MDTFDDLTEKELLSQLAYGDEKAFSAIYHKYWSLLYRYAYNRIRINEVCQDIVQEVFTDIWKRKASLDIQNLSGYLHTSVRFLTYKQLTKLPVDSTSYYTEFEQTLQSYLTAENPLLEKELQQLLESWIEALPEKRRKIFLLHYFEGYSTERIADELSISRKTVQNQLTTAKSELLAKYAHLLGSIIILGSIYRDF